VPQDDVHARNLVLGPTSPSPKKARVERRTPSKASLGLASLSQLKGPTGAAAGASHAIASHEKLARAALPSLPSPAWRVAGTPSKAAQRTSASTSTSRSQATGKTTSVVTTTRVDKTVRVSEHERQLRLAQQQDEANIWRGKFRRAFPNFTFYFDSYDTVLRIQVTKAVESLGGRVEQFFSKKVTHLVTTRLVPNLPVAPADAGTKSASSKKATPAASARKGKELAMEKPWAGLPQTIEAARRAKQEAGLPTPQLVLGKRQNEVLRSVPIHSDRNPFDEPGPVPASNDIVYKAKGFGMKVWHHSKLTTILNMLLGDQSTTVNQAAKEDLGALLQREKVEGTTERDPNAPRADFYYFPTKIHHYLLVEDATGEHRPIMIQEYEKAKDMDAAARPPWPKLYGELEGRCPFTRYDVSKHAGRSEKKPTQEKTLRRALSLSKLGGPGAGKPHESGLSALGGHGGGPYGEAVRSLYNADIRHSGIGRESATAAPYQLASGNSVTITSNIASTALASTTSFGPGSFGAPVGQGQGALVGLGFTGTTPFPHGTSALAQLSRRMQTFGPTQTAEREEGGSQAAQLEPQASNGPARLSPVMPDPEQCPAGDCISADAGPSKRASLTPDQAGQPDDCSGERVAGAIHPLLPPERGAMGPPLLPNERKMSAPRGHADPKTPSMPPPPHTRSTRTPAGGPSGIDAARRFPGALGGIRRSVSVNEGLRVRAANAAAAAVVGARGPAAPKREKDKKPGYCENCRVKFDDIEEHVLTKKHQRFATNPKNFEEIDQLILRCQGLAE